ncbi:MAG: hypothetical protein ACJ705_09700 [Nitrososphaeraceae archaeon]
MPNESFTFSYDVKRGLVIEFKPTPKYNDDESEPEGCFSYKHPYV